MNLEQDRSQGCLLGLAVGDAVGTTLEFRSRDSYEHITDMVGGGPFSLPVGAWTDDTSMALCLAISLLENGFSLDDQIRRYCKWYQDGYLSSTGTCFDIGGTVSSALHTYSKTGDPVSGSTSSDAAGNGSLMRLAPVVEYFYPDNQKIVGYARESSRTTHGTDECLDACELFSVLLYRAIRGDDKEEVLAHVPLKNCSENMQCVATMRFLSKGRDQIRGSGYVVESLEAALWCFAETDNFKDAILLAANLGDDADTTAAICGQIAGGYYGMSDIPEGWINQLVMSGEIVDIARQLYEVAA